MKECHFLEKERRKEKEKHNLKSHLEYSQFVVGGEIFCAENNHRILVVSWHHLYFSYCIYE